MNDIENYVDKINDAKIIEEEDEWSKGFNSGLEWAIRILNKDKSAY
jgi:hypothetical protein